MKTFPKHHGFPFGRRALELAAALAAFGAAVSAAETYPQLILADDPVAYWRFEEAAGAIEAADSSANGWFPGTYVSPDGTVPRLEQPGIDVNSAYFRSSKDAGGARLHSYVEVPYAAELNPAGPFSVEAWVRPMSAGTGDEYRSPLGSFEGWGATDYPGWFFYQSPEAGGNPSVWIWVMKGGGIWVQGGPINKYQWEHLAAVYDGANVSFYVNGTRVATVSAAGFLPTTTRSLFIGSLPTGDYPFDGNVDEVAIYSRALTLEQIQARYQLGLVSFREAEVPPEITQQPEPTTVYAGHEATFRVVADGTQPLSYQWFRGGTPVPEATTEVLQFIATEADNGQMVSVTITNALGSTTSTEAALTVSTELVITAPPAATTRSVGSVAAFRVAASGALPISYQWYEGTTPIPGATAATLWLPPLTAADEGRLYHVKVSNPWTSVDSDEVMLTVVPRTTEVPITGYAKVILADHPVAYWRLNEPDGSTIATDAAGSFDGTYEAGEGSFVHGVLTGVPGETDPAVSVTAKARVTVPHALELNPQGPFAAEAWFKPATLSVDGQDYRTIFSSLGSGPTGWLLYQQPSHMLAWVLFGDSWSVTAWLAGAQAPLVADTWYHVVLQSDGSVFSMYLNGELLAAQEWSAYYVANKDGRSNFGWRSDNDWKPFDGTLDEVAFYRQPLTPAQIQAHYQASVQITLTRANGNAVLAWPFGTLQHADVVSGPYTDVTGATSPYTATPSGTAKFYRVKL